MGSEGKNRILIFTCQNLHHNDRPSNGGSLRMYGLGEALKARGHEVIYSVPQRYLNGSVDISSELRNNSHNVTDIGDKIAEINPATVIFGNWGLADEALECDVPTVVDINGSLILENFYRKQHGILDDALAKIRALTKADLILAGSYAQKMYLTAWCLMAGISPTHLSVEVVPFSLPPQLPVPRPPDELTFVMAGYNWPWLNGQKAIEEIGLELEKRNCGHLHIYTDSPPYSDILPKEDSSSDRASELKREHLNRVSFHDTLPYDHLIDVLCKSSVAVDVWEKNIERELAFSTRTVTYLWSGLPVIGNSFGGLAELIKRYKAGWAINSNDNGQLGKLLKKIISDPKQLLRYGQNAQRLVRECLTWDKTIDPLDRFCRLPRKNRSFSPFLHLINRFEQDHQQLVHNLEAAHKTTEHQKQEVKRQRENIARQNQRIWEQNRKNEMMEKQISALHSQRELMGMVHRRPKGFALLTSPVLGWRLLRRLVIGLPVLMYLFLLTRIGLSVETIWNWWRRA